MVGNVIVHWCLWVAYTEPVSEGVSVTPPTNFYDFNAFYFFLIQTSFHS